MSTGYRVKITQSNIKNGVFSTAGLPYFFPSLGMPITIVDEEGREYPHHMHNDVKRIDGMTRWYRNHPTITPEDEVEFSLMDDGKFLVQPVSAHQASPEGSDSELNLSLDDNCTGDSRRYETTVSDSGAGQGYSISQKAKKLVENHAMSEAEKHFRGLGYNVTDVSKYKSFDLSCTRDNEEVHLEVKGSQTTGESIILTYNEVKHAQANKDKMALFVLHDILVDPDEQHASGGEPLIFYPWDVDDGELKPISFRYNLPK